MVPWIHLTVKLTSCLHLIAFWDSGHFGDDSIHLPTNTYHPHMHGHLSWTHVTVYLWWLASLVLRKHLKMLLRSLVSMWSHTTWSVHLLQPVVKVPTWILAMRSFSKEIWYIFTRNSISMYFNQDERKMIILIITSLWGAGNRLNIMLSLSKLKGFFL